MSEAQPASIVYVVDDDGDARFGVKLLLESAGYAVAEFEDGANFLENYQPGPPACLILDINMPHINGLELQEHLARDGVELPIIFLTGHADVPAAVTALKAGAVDFLQKPVSDDRQLISLVDAALAQNASYQARAAEQRDVSDRAAKLTPREAEIMQLICDGQANKVIAIDLGISERTVELHRGRMMKKLGVRSVAELISLNNLLK